MPLEALLAERSVTKAAAAVGLSQPAMSNALARLRRLLSDELLTRVGKEYELTDRARALVEPVAETLRVIRTEVLTPPGFDPTTSSRTFTIAATNATALALLPALIRDLSATAPGVRLRLLPLPPSADELLAHAAVDVVLLPDVLPTTHPRERLFEDRWVCVVDVDNERVGDELTLEVFAALPHVVYESEAGRTAADMTLESLGLHATVRIRAKDFLLIPLLLRGTRMVAVVQERLALSLAAAGSLRVLPPPTAVPKLGIDLVCNPRRNGDPALAWLRSRLLAAASVSPDSATGTDAEAAGEERTSSPDDE
ncbi:MAG: LysR family transcriptional regulator [Pseudonocardia sp.]|nr:LysR family transcriptional regulator [Pseudonocardia sp.]MBO0875076.1 LysR family transcriptional regulator [Pseudonocardia sp.]